MEIRDHRREDVRPVVAAAFAAELAVADLVDALRAAPTYRASLVALDPDPVGHVLLSRGWVDDPRGLVDVVVLSPLSVRPDRQRQGVGTALVDAALERARTDGEAYVFLEGDPAYYGRRGFGPALPQGFASPSTRIPDAAFQVAVLREDGARGALVYPDAFWRFDAVGLR